MTSENIEVWKDLYGWEAYYEVSDHGRIRSKVRPRKPHRGLIPRKQRGGKIVKHIFNDRKYPCVNLTGGGKRTQYLVHLAVMRSFFGPAPEGMETCHNDGNPANTHISNFRYDTRKNNHADKILHGRAQRGENNGLARLTTEYVLKLRSRELTEQQVMAELGVSKGCVNKAKYRTTWKHV